MDKDTSGVLLFARHTDAQRHLSHQFQNNTVQKEYLALVAGKPAADEGRVEERLGVSASNPKLGGSLHWGGNFFTIDGVGFNDLGNGGAAYSYQTALSTTPSVDTCCPTSGEVWPAPWMS